MVVPGSQQVKTQAEAEGIADVFRTAGADWREAGCSMCIAMNGDQGEAGEYIISTSNRNFEGRQGKGARTFLASPLTAAASALTGEVTDRLIAAEVDLAVVYHPLLFRPVTSLVAGNSPAGRAFRLIANNVALMTVHTAFDVIAGGTADALADAVGLTGAAGFGPAWGGDSVKVITFVPAEAVAATRAFRDAKRVVPCFPRGNVRIIDLEEYRVEVGAEFEADGTLKFRRRKKDIQPRRVGLLLCLGAIRLPSELGHLLTDGTGSIDVTHVDGGNCTGQVFRNRNVRLVDGDRSSDQCGAGRRGERA